MSDRIGPTIARLRTTAGYSQTQLASRLCEIARHPTVTRNDVSRWEREGRIPRTFWLSWLARALDTGLDGLRAACVHSRAARAAGAARTACADHAARTAHAARAGTGQPGAGRPVGPRPVGTAGRWHRGAGR